MQNGKNNLTYTPYISKKDLRSALDSIITPSSAPPKLDSLSSLILVEEVLADPTLPKIQNPNELAIYTVLIDLITTTLVTVRRQLNLLPPPQDENLSDAIQNISVDGQHGSTELLYWSFLYYHYVRIEFNITLDKFSELINLAQRTIRRYRSQAIDRLWHKLIFTEQQARIRQRERRLQAQLPVVTSPTHLYGRKNQWKTAQNALINKSNATMLITGATGIGKTTFVQEFLRQHIQAKSYPTIDQIIWIENPTNVGQVYDQLHNLLPMTTAAITIREWMALYNLIVVIDDAESLIESPSDFDTLLSFLDPATVFVLSHTHTPSTQVDVRITLKELDTITATQFISQVAQTARPEDIHTVHAVAGGNPLAILMTINNAIIGDMHISTGVLEHLLKQAYLNLAMEEKRAWFALALCPPGDIAEENILALWSKYFAPIHISTLIQRHLISVASIHPQKYRCLTIARNYIINLYQQSSECLNLINDLISAISEQVAETSQFTMEVIAYLSNQTWLNIDQALKRQWGATLLQTENLQNHPQWPILATRIFSAAPFDSDNTAKITYGIALRQLARWDEAEAVFYKMIEQTGQTGDFLQQAHCRVELCAVLRYFGRYEEAVLNVQQAERTARRYGNIRLIDLALLENAQLAIDQSNGQQALEYLQRISNIHDVNLRYSLLLSEAYFLIGNFAACKETVEKILPKVAHDRLVSGRFQDLIGRVYLTLNDHKKAYHRFSIAISSFDVSESPFALARCLSNLGAVLFHLGYYDEAQENLLRAQHIQHKLGDAVGLATTEHNLKITHNLSLRRHRGLGFPPILDDDLSLDNITQ